MEEVDREEVEEVEEVKETNRKEVPGPRPLSGRRRYSEQVQPRGEQCFLSLERQGMFQAPAMPAYLDLSPGRPS